MKVAVIGAGRMGRRHVQVIRNAGLELVGIADRSRDALGLAKDECSLPDGMLYEDAARLLAERRPRCVVVATTAPSHFEYSRCAVKSGAELVLCEKPLGVSIAECDRMVELCGAHGVRLAVNHQMRFMDQYTIPKQIVEAPPFGGLASVTVVAGNFGMAMNGTHYFEMFRYMTGEAPVEVSAWFSQNKVPNPRGPEFEDRAGVVRAITATGRRFYMDASDDQGHGMQVTYAGKYGVLWVDELAGEARLVVRKAEHRALPTTRYGMPWDESRLTIAPADAIKPSEAVLNALLEGKGYPTGEDGRLAVSVLVAAHVSDERAGARVSVDDALPRDRVFPWA
jgi:predicted dehydrogenase